ncbi:hypothetical protein N0V90_005496 [Kalmusia sp. IMI 367209]|nr:hypothetical protein N0V90_005496 [Kalmusia sp. IMI 367209]
MRAEKRNTVTAAAKYAVKAPLDFLAAYPDFTKSFVGLETSGSSDAKWIKTLVFSNVGIRASVIGIALSILSGATGTFGMLPSLLGASSTNLLMNELRSFVTFHGLKWVTRNLEGLWLTFTEISWELKAMFLGSLLPQNEADKDDNKDQPERIKWACGMLRTVTARIAQFPLAALSPALDAIIKARKDDDPKEPTEGIDEWTEVKLQQQPQDQDLWTSLSYPEVEHMEGSTVNLAAYLAETQSEDFGSDHPSLEELESLEKIARQAFQHLGVKEEDVKAVLVEMGLDDGTMAWMEEVDDSEIIQDGMDAEDDEPELLNLVDY